MSLYVLVLLGGQSLGGVIMGRLVEFAGPQVGMLVSGLVPAVAAAVMAVIIARRHHLPLPIRLRRP
jgi:hypothetical protein